ncbi:hypothetical protein V5F89_01375 [Pelagerythrobacter marensis]|uniref:Uncharacterized protein n=1 Tax=Pelagerythrobacter marensis TaxID=543877 RepID=A0ABZ2D3G0_9SPHN
MSRYIAVMPSTGSQTGPDEQSAPMRGSVAALHAIKANTGDAARLSAGAR